MSLTEERIARQLLRAYRYGLDRGQAGAPNYHNPHCPINEGALFLAWDDGWTAGTTEHHMEDAA